MWIQLLAGRVRFASAASASSWLAAELDPMELAAPDAGGPFTSAQWVAAVDHAYHEGLDAPLPARATARALLESTLAGEGALLEVRGARVTYRSGFDDGAPATVLRAVTVLSCFARAGQWGARGALLLLHVQPTYDERVQHYALCVEKRGVRLAPLSFDEAVDAQDLALSMDPAAFDPAVYQRDEDSEVEEY